MACDLHCHSKISDGSMGIDEIIAIEGEDPDGPDGP